MLEIWLNPGLNLIIFEEPGPDVFFTLTFSSLNLDTTLSFAPHFCPPEIYRPIKNGYKKGDDCHLLVQTSISCRTLISK